MKRARMLGVALAVASLSTFCPSTSAADRLAVSGGHTCAITSSSGVKCWGANSVGQIGNGQAQSLDEAIANRANAKPTSVYGIQAGAEDVSVYDAMSCAVVNDSVRCWGGFFHLIFGGAPQLVAQTVSGLEFAATDVAVGHNFACAVQSGTAKCWGVSEFGQLGDGQPVGFTVSPSPKGVVGLASGVSAVAADYYNACAIVNGGVWCWGSNSAGQLGNANYLSASSSMPVRVDGLDHDVTSIAISGRSACAVQDGAVKCWGNNYGGVLGVGSDATSIKSPQAVVGLDSGVTKIVSGFCAVQSGAAKCWGFNDYGRLGNGTMTQSASLVQVTGLDSGVGDIASNQASGTCALHYLHGESLAKCWGNNRYGQLGAGIDDAYSVVPRVVKGLEDDVPSSEIPSPDGPTIPFEPTARSVRSTNCKRLMIIGVRGSGENGPNDTLLGGPAKYMATKLKRRLGSSWSSKYVGEYGVPYDAISVRDALIIPGSYYFSKNAGASMLETYIKDSRSVCPKQRYVLVGYSQGAHVVGDVLSATGSSALSARTRRMIDGVVMFGDPKWNFDDLTIVHMGSFSDHNNLNWNGEAYSGLLRPRRSRALRGASKDYRVYSFCRYRDPVCQGLLNGKHNREDAWYKYWPEHEKYAGSEDAGLAAKLMYLRTKHLK